MEKDTFVTNLIYKQSSLISIQNHLIWGKLYIYYSKNQKQEESIWFCLVYLHSHPAASKLEQQPD